MVKLHDGGVYLINGETLVSEAEAAKVEQMTGRAVAKEEAKKIGTCLPVQSWKRSVPIPAVRRAVLEFNPVIKGTNTKAPKATNNICKPTNACLPMLCTSTGAVVV